jgi:hypothetical protein
MTRNVWLAKMLGDCQCWKKLERRGVTLHALLREVIADWFSKAA